MNNKCVIVGNSPNINNLGDKINSHDVIVRTGNPVISTFEQHVGSRTDILVSRDMKRQKISEEFLRQFKFIYVYPESDIKPKPSAYFIYSKCEINIDNNILDQVDIALNLKPNEKPTLGLMAVCIMSGIYNNINICGIETEYTSKYLHKGYYNNHAYMRANDHHSIRKELLYLNKLIRRQVIHILNNK